jgi:superfamily II DNA or RNA helicase
MQMVGRVMRPARGKKTGIVLDNAGLWHEHGLPDEPREWALKGTKKKKQDQAHPHPLAALDDGGRLRPVERTRPSEAKGLRLVPITGGVKRLLRFERILFDSRTRNQKLLAAYYRWKEEVQNSKLIITAKEIDYVAHRLDPLNLKLPPEQRYKQGFWYRQKKEMGLG